MSASVDATIEALVAHALEQRADVIERLVHAELERRVGQLVDQRLNGGHHSPPAASNGQAATIDPSAPTRRCNGCQRDLPADAFSPMSYTCRACRNRRWRERQAARRAAAAGEEATPG